MLRVPFILIFFLSVLLFARPNSSSLVPSIRIGYIAALSGNESAHKALKALKLLVAEWNLSGGIAGRKIELFVYDNKHSPINNFALFRQIKKDRLVALTGVHSSNDGLIIAKLAEQMHLPLVVASATHPDITRDKRYVVRVCFDNREEAIFLSRFAHKEIRAQKVAILTDVSDSFATSLSLLFSRDFLRMGGKIIFRQDIRTHDRDFTSFIQTLSALKEKPDAILASTSAMEGGYLISQLASSGLSIPVIGNDSWQGDNLELALKKIVQGGMAAYFPAHWHVGVPFSESKKFLKEYENKYHEKIGSSDVDAILTYDAGKLLLNALQRSASVEPEVLVSALKKNSVSGVSGKIDLDEGPGPRKPIYLLSIRKGNLFTAKEAE